jgi:hypothetical protein
VKDIIAVLTKKNLVINQTAITQLINIVLQSLQLPALVILRYTYSVSKQKVPRIMDRTTYVVSEYIKEEGHSKARPC